MSARVFKPGDRVRINRSGLAHGREGTVLERVISDAAHRVRITGRLRRAGTAFYHVQVDGIGARWPKSKKRIAFIASQLIPITPTAGFQEFMTRITQPVGCLDAPPAIAPKRERVPVLIPARRSA